jgi:predicted membrane-bound mannosyltransferase
MAATDPGGGAGNFLTRKLGPLPIWVWVGVGVAALYLYRSRQQAAQAQSAGTDAATSALANQGAAAMQYGYTAPDLASMISNLQGQVSALGAGNVGTTTTKASSPGSTGNPATLPAQKLTGAGWGPGTEVPITVGGHSYEWISSWAVLSHLPPGSNTFYQPVQGLFVPLKNKTGGYLKVPAGTPQFLMVS